MMLLATRSKTFEQNPFEHISGLIDNMVTLLKKEQADDNRQKGFCDAEIQKAGEDKAATEDSIKSGEASIAETNELIETVESEIATLKQGIQDLDRSVALATEQRKQEHAEFTSTSAANQAALELLDMAKNRMNKFYNPSMYKDTATQAPIYGFFEEQQSSLMQQKKQQAGGVVQLLATM